MAEPIRFFRYGAEMFRLMPGERVAQALTKTFGRFNADAEPTILSDREILEETAREDQEAAAILLSQFAEALRLLEQAPLRSYPYESMRDQFAPAIYERVRNSPPLPIKSSSTRTLDPRRSDYIDAAEKTEELKKNTTERLTVARAYLKIWGGDLERVRAQYAGRLPLHELALAFPDIQKVYDASRPTNLYQRTAFTDAQGEIVEARYHLSSMVYYFSLLYPNELILVAIAFVDHYRNDIERAADIISHHHPELGRDNIANLLAASLLEEIANLTGEDPVQDVETCYATECAVEERLAVGLGDHHAGWVKRLFWKGINAILGRGMQGYVSQGKWGRC